MGPLLQVAGSSGAIDRDLKVERSVFGIGYTRGMQEQRLPQR
jgi:hypothetical protein